MRFTDGTTTITIANGVSAAPGDYSYNADEFAPGVTQRASDDALGSIPFDEVVETLQLTITGSTVAAMYANVDALATLMERAQRFADGDLSVAPVVWQYIPAGSSRATGSPYEAIVLGAATPGERILTLPPTWAKSGQTQYVIGVTLRFRRVGVWLNETDTEVASAATSTGSTWSVTLPSYDMLSPCIVRWDVPTIPNTANTYGFGNQLLIFAAAAADIMTLEAEAFGSNFNSIAVANARGGAIGALNAAVAWTLYESNAIAPPAGLSAEGTYAVFAWGALNSSGVQADLQVVFNTNTAGLTDGIVTPWYRMPSDVVAASGPHLLGTVSFSGPDPISAIRLRGRSDTLGAGNSINLDYLLFIRISPDVTILTIRDGIRVETTWGTTAIEGRIDHRLTTELEPLVSFRHTNGTNDTGVGYQGQAIIWQRGSNLSGVYCAANYRILGAGFAGLYRLANSAGAVYSPIMRVTRRRAYMVPE